MANIPQENAAPVDLTGLREITEGDTALEKRLASLFSEQAELNLLRLRECCRTQDAAAWRDAAHKFKGSAGSIGAQRLSALCCAGQDFSGTAEEMASLFEDISDEFVRVRLFLEKAAGLVD